MMKKNRLITRTIILLVLLGAVVFTIYSSLQKDNTSVGINDSAPNFSLNSLEGTEYELDKLKGKGVLVNFWGTWCKPCKEEMPYMEELYHEYQDQGFEILAVNVSETEVAVKGFVNEYGLTFPVLIDTRSDVLDAFQVSPLPTSFFIDSKGKIVSIKTGTMTKKMIEDEIKKIIPS